MRLFEPLTLLVLAAAACGDANGMDDGKEPGAPPMKDDSKTEQDAPDDAVHRHTNLLAKESSPYLLQHQHNPVEWYPWGDEAFEKARREDKPVFLSIGYSTCHWCHVMERESFESEEMAAVLNEHFISIKVDREERPDVDAIYMKAVQTMTGRGGWPLSVWLTHDRKPFFGGTYFPPEDRHGRPGFKTILERVAALWRERRDDLIAQADNLTDHVRSQNSALDGAEIGAGTLDAAVRLYSGAFDREWGGFGPPPKFPRAFSISFLLRQTGRGDADTILPMVSGTLDRMRLGGLHDHLGGGFHRYSTDREWLVHFEKMLYDQALLARAYTEALQVTGNNGFARAARGTCDYVLRDLRDAAGGFHSAEDADSEGEEGKFYVWTQAEVRDVLGAEHDDLFCNAYRITREGNYVDEASHSRTGSSIPHLAAPVGELAEGLSEEPAALAEKLTALRGRLFEARGTRVRPHLDDKVLTDWNGLMIGTLAYCGRKLSEPRYTKAATEAAEFVQGTMWDGDVLLHRYREGDAGIPGFLDDYAFLANGFLELHQTTQDPRWLRAALDIGRAMVTKFRDDREGGFFLAPRDGEKLVSHTKELYDGALPSGNSAAAYVLLRLGRVSGDAGLEKVGRDTLAAWSGTIARYPMGFPFALMALDFDVGPAREIVIAGGLEDPRTKALLAEVNQRFLPRTVVIVHPPGEPGAAARKLSPFIAEQGLVDGTPAAYVCTNYACKAPVTTPAALRELLD